MPTAQDCGGSFMLALNGSPIRYVNLNRTGLRADHPNEPHDRSSATTSGTGPSFRRSHSNLHDKDQTSHKVMRLRDWPRAVKPLPDWE